VHFGTPQRRVDSAEENMPTLIPSSLQSSPDLGLFHFNGGLRAPRRCCGAANSLRSEATHDSKSSYRG
jgi:hypothetical protein